MKILLQQIQVSIAILSITKNIIVRNTDDTIISSIHLPSVDENTTNTMVSSHASSNYERTENVYYNEQYNQLQSQLQEQRQLILQDQNDHHVFVKQQQLKGQQQELILQQHDEQIQLQQQLLKQQKQEIKELKDKFTMHLQQNSKSCGRPDLGDISRKNLLTPRAKRFYERTVQLKKEKRRLKRRIKQIASRTIQCKTN